MSIIFPPPHPENRPSVETLFRGVKMVGRGGGGKKGGETELKFYGREKPITFFRGINAVGGSWIGMA